MFNPYGVNEMLTAKQSLASIPDDSLTAFDKGFLSAGILSGLTGAGANCHFVINENLSRETRRWCRRDAGVATRSQEVPRMQEHCKRDASTVIDFGDASHSV
jgi:hypothetical protein